MFWIRICMLWTTILIVILLLRYVHSQHSCLQITYLYKSTCWCFLDMIRASLHILQQSARCNYKTNGIHLWNICSRLAKYHLYAQQWSIIRQYSHAANHSAVRAHEHHSFARWLDEHHLATPQVSIGPPMDFCLANHQKPIPFLGYALHSIFKKRF